MSEPESDFEKLASRAQIEFGDVLDFIWKSPRFAESEFKREVIKTALYYPITGDDKEDKRAIALRAFRMEEEVRRTKTSYPYLMNIGNIFATFSLFETYCLYLCKKAESVCDIKLQGVPGAGITRLLKHLQLCGVDLNRIPLRQEVLNAAMVRNCLSHANGLLSLSRDETALRAIVAKATYMSKEHRQKRAQLGSVNDELEVQSGPLGDQLVATNKYAWRLCFYLRNHFIELCQATEKLLAEAS